MQNTNRSLTSYGLSTLSGLGLAMALIFFAVSALGAERLVGMTVDEGSAEMLVGGEPVRLVGIHFPTEQGLCSLKVNGCKKLAMTALKAWLDAPEKVECEVVQIMTSGMHAVHCTAEGEDVGAWLVSRGLALADRRSSRAYVRDEQAARQAGIGLWNILTLVAAN